jgi:hypothetical protein
MRLIGRAGRDGSDARLDARLADLFDDRRTPGAPESLYAYVREVSMMEQEEPLAARLRRKWSGLGRTARIGVSLAAVLVIVAGAVAVIGLRSGPAGPGASSPSPAAIPSRPAAPSGWRLVNALGSADDAGGLWAGTHFADASDGYRVIAVHVSCTGADDLLVILGTSPTDDWTGQAMQSAVFRCDIDPSAGESRVVFTAPDKPFTQMWAVIVRHPSSLAKNDWVVSLEAPEAG